MSVYAEVLVTLLDETYQCNIEFQDKHIYNWYVKRSQQILLVDQFNFCLKFNKLAQDDNLVQSISLIRKLTIHPNDVHFRVYEKIIESGTSGRFTVIKPEIRVTRLLTDKSSCAPLPIPTPIIQ